MNTLFILDKDSKTELSEDLRAKICRILTEKGHQIETVELVENEALPCLGCWKCLIDHPGECVSQDTINEIKKKARKYDLTIFLTTVLFGHFSSTIKNAIDRGTGTNNWQIMIGYGSDIDDEEKSTFIDLTAKHRGSADIVHPGMDTRVDVFVTRSISDNSTICEALKNI